AENNLDRWCANLVPPDQKSMEMLGVFGEQVADEGMDRNGMPGRGDGGNRPVLLRAFGAMPARAAAKSEATASLSVKEAPAAAPPELPAERSSTPLVQPTIRKEFADTALWNALLETNKEGIAVAELDMPQNLTTWKLRAWAMGHGTRVGDASTQVVT